jgi:hypothetical protein
MFVYHTGPITNTSFLINSVFCIRPGPPLLGRSKLNASNSGILLHGSSSPDKMQSYTSTYPIAHNHALRLALVGSQPRSSIPSLALHVKASVAVIQHWANVPRYELHDEASSVP